MGRREEKQQQLKACNGRVGSKRAEELSLVRENIRVPYGQKHLCDSPPRPLSFEPLTYGFRDMGQQDWAGEKGVRKC